MDWPRTVRSSPAGPTTGGTIWASPAVDRDGTVYVTSMDGKLYALNPNGTTKWTHTAGAASRSSPAIGPEGNVYFGTDAGRVRAVSPSGALLWSRSAGTYIDSSPAVDAFGNVIVGSWNGKVYALRPDDGSTVWEFSTGGLIQSPPTLGVDGVVYVGNGAGRLYALGNVASFAHSTWPMFRQNPRHSGNPATLTLSAGQRLVNGQFRFQIRGLSGMVCTVEAADNLEAWSPLPNPSQPASITLPSSGVVTFTDTQAAGYAHRFYRVRGGSILSYNSLGYMAVAAPAGYSMLANHGLAMEQVGWFLGVPAVAAMVIGGLHRTLHRTLHRSAGHVRSARAQTAQHRCDSVQ